jgi:hypothetical protein
MFEEQHVVGNAEDGARGAKLTSAHTLSPSALLLGGVLPAQHMSSGVARRSLAQSLLFVRRFSIKRSPPPKTAPSTAIAHAPSTEWKPVVDKKSGCAG